jgi:Type II site-specific deoxyribonuclease
VAADLESQGFPAFASVLVRLTPRRRALLLRMAEALTVPADVVRYDSDLVDDAFSETLANSLLLHHAIHEEPLNKESFEYVMKGCAEAAGHEAELNPGRGTATWDVMVDGVRWSLKTEAARGISLGTVKIEKLMEARWIRECTNPAKCAAAVSTQIPAHMAGYDRILVLRAFRLAGGGMRYDLVEPPVELILQKLSAVPASVFTKEGAKESYGASIDDAYGGRIFRILLDSSVEKIRIWFSVGHCRPHGSWTVKSADIQQLASVPAAPRSQ